MRHPPIYLNLVMGISGAIVGALLGYYVFFILNSFNIYALALPGALIGLGCGASSRIHSIGLGIFCAIFALVLGLYAEWQRAPMLADSSFLYLVTHAHELTRLTQIMLALGCVFGGWFGIGRTRFAQSVD